MLTRPVLIIGLLALLTGGCVPPLKPPAPPMSAPPPAVVSVMRPFTRDMKDQLEYPARTAAVEMVEVRSRVGGYLLKVDFKDGAEVKQGELLFQIDSAPYKAAFDQAEANVRSAEAKLATQELELKRYRSLLGRGGISQQTVDQTLGSRNESAANLQATKAALERARLDLSYTKIVAPISGRTSRRLVTPGNVVIANETILTTIVSMEPLYVYFDVDETAVLRARKMIKEKKAQSYRDARIPVYLELSNETNFPHEGYIDFAESALDPNTGTLNVRGVFPNPKGEISPGLFARVRIPLGTSVKAILVPERALNVDQRGEFVKVVAAGNLVEDRVVVPGRADGEYVIIEKGLTAKDLVIVRGMQRARPGARVSPKFEAAPTPNPKK
jgi:RND family efflux transporter MFP subunit